jgi:hypothetical protein
VKKMTASHIVGPCAALIRARPRAMVVHFIAGYTDRIVLTLREPTGPKRLNVQLGAEDAKRIRRALVKPALLLEDAARAIQDAFALEDLSGCTAPQQEALAAIRGALDALDARRRNARSDALLGRPDDQRDPLGTILGVGYETEIHTTDPAVRVVRDGRWVGEVMVQYTADSTSAEARELAKLAAAGISGRLP